MKAMWPEVQTHALVTHPGRQPSERRGPLQEDHLDVLIHGETIDGREPRRASSDDSHSPQIFLPTSRHGDEPPSMSTERVSLRTSLVRTVPHTRPAITAIQIPLRTSVSHVYTV